MKLKEYFRTKQGTGVLSTVNGKGVPNSAIYARPHFLGEDTIAFIMRDRLTHANISENPKAHYMFIEHEHGTKGLRLVLEKISESTDKQRITQLSRRPKYADVEEERYLVSFHVTKAVSLIGGVEIPIEEPVHPVTV